MASALSASFEETPVLLRDDVLSPTEEVLSIFPESSCIETDVVAEELQRVRLQSRQSLARERFEPSSGWSVSNT